MRQTSFKTKVSHECECSDKIIIIIRVYVGGERVIVVLMIILM